MAITVTYNGVTLSNPLGKVRFTDGERSMVFSADFAVTPANLESDVASLSEWDKAFSLTAGTWTKSFLLNSEAGGATAYTAARTTVEKVGDPLDSNGLKKLRFTIEIFRQTRLADGFRQYTVTAVTNPQGQQTVTIRGEVTGDGSTDVITVFETGIAAIDTMWVGTGAIFEGDFEKPETTYDSIDRYNGVMQFTRTHVQLYLAENTDSGGDIRDPDIIFPRWSIERLKTFRTGRPEDVPIVRYACNWSALLDIDKSETEVISDFDTGIRTFVHNRLASIFGVTVAELTFESDAIRYERTGQVANANWIVQVASETVSYLETNNVHMSFLSADKFADGKDFTMQFKSTGTTGDVSQTIKHVTRNTTPPPPIAPNIVLNTESDSGLALSDSNQSYTSEYQNGVEEVTLEWRAEYIIGVTPLELSTGRTAARAASQTYLQGALQGGDELLTDTPEDGGP